MTENNTKRCPYCDNEVRIRAVKCQFCNEWFDDRLAGQSPASGSHLGPPSSYHPGSPSGSYTGSPPVTPSGSQPSTPSGHTPLTGIHHVNHALGDRYEILEEIGRGGMATVYKAIQKSLKRPVALKVVHQNLLHDTEFVARFHREAQLCASLNHPNIVTVHDEGEVSGVHFMAMEYLEGTDLHRLIRSRGRLTAEQTLQYLLPVAEALDYAHGRGLIHRDIKSANIFITGSGRVVLMDFGIAHAAAGTQLTRAGTVIGTPEYMSPEQAEGKKVDHRTDLYSLGVVMYECLAGRVPFSGENAMSTIFQLTRNEPDDKPLGQTPAAIRQLVTALLRKNPENRPATARSVAEGIKLLQQGKQWRPPGVTSTEAASGSKYTGEQTQEPQTVKLGDKPGRASSQGRAASQGSVSPPKEKKKVPAAVWFLALLGLVLVFVLVYQYNEQQRVKEQREEARIEERRVEEQRREEERKAREADRQRRLAEEQRQREQEEAERNLAEQQRREQQEAERQRQLALQRQREQQEADRQRQLAEQRRREHEVAERQRQLAAQRKREEEARRQSSEQTSSGTFRDNRDGQTYKWVRIGNKVWMAENLNYKTRSGSWCYDNSTINCKTYGRLYNWQTALNACSPGWRLPSDAEWTQLTNYVGSNAGTKLKAKSGWRDGGNGTDDFGFSALMGGVRGTDGSFSGLGTYGFWWSSTEGSSTTAWNRDMDSSYGGVLRYNYLKPNGFSVRCVREQ